MINWIEIIFICFGIVAMILGSIISIWTKLDSDFKNIHKPALKENDFEMSSVRSTLLRTDKTGSVNITSNRHEGSIGNDEQE